ncbi:hypothetical protein CPLU01_07756 [Colletotrichum plurivorum]|uniref:Uncharacterized protein n=1 Tax=Colletotrichum plurivorum TaxID=2175906 RepID=A0A8H6KEI2_9PEZI|nr:hypothetical protein CPLU01_07756 [Colletotrichum plurivorum]
MEHCISNGPQGEHTGTLSDSSPAGGRCTLRPPSPTVRIAPARPARSVASHDLPIAQRCRTHTQTRERRSALSPLAFLGPHLPYSDLASSPSARAASSQRTCGNLENQEILHFGEGWAGTLSSSSAHTSRRSEHPASTA